MAQENNKGQTVQTLMRSLSDRLKDVEWISCPCCTNEYMRLRPCNYLDDEKKPAVAYLCVKCAETLVGWDWLTFSMPLPTAFLTYTKWIAPRERRVGPKPEDIIDQPHNAVVYVEVGGMEIVAKSEGAGRGIRYKIKGQEEVHNAENIYQLRSKMLHTIPY